MATQIEQLYSKNHWDDGNYTSLLNYYKGKDWKKGLEIGFAWSMSCQAFLNATDGTLLSIDAIDAMERADEMKRMYGDRWDIKYGDSSTLMSKLKDKYD